MQERGRVVRAVSEDTERPYFKIRYRLSLSGRELLGEALNLSTPMDVDANGSVEGNAPYSMKRRSKSMHSMVHSSSSSHQDNSSITGLLPSKKYSKISHKLCAVPEDQQAIGSDQMKRTRSVGQLEVEVNRYGGPKLDPGNIKSSEPSPMGLVTCLNSKNIKKYSIGQKYRKGVIVAIDEEQRKIVVYHKYMPRGALTLVATNNAPKYEKGYPVEDSDGTFLGCVHAVDRVQRLLVVNTQMTEEDYPVEPFSNNSRRLSEVIVPNRK